MAIVLRFAGVLPLGLALIAGCASRPADSGFTQVQKTVADRAGQQVYWNTSSADDARADAGVAQLLGHDLTADTAVQIALLNNPKLQATFEELGIAQADLVRAGLLKNPIFNGAYEFAAGGGLAKVNLSVTEDFLSILQIPLHERVAGKALEAAQLNVTQAALDLTANVRSSFYEYEAAQQILALRQTASAGKKVSADVAKRFNDAGNMSDLDLANEQAMEGQAAIESGIAEADAMQKRENLNELLGLMDDRALAWKTAAKLPDVPAVPPTSRNFESLAMTQRLDLLAAKKQAQSAAGELGIAQQFALFSDASAGASAEREHDGTWETGPVVSIPIPLFDFGGASVAAARARLRQSQRKYQQMKIDVEAEVRRAESRLNIAIESARCYHDIVLPARKKISQQTMLRYDGMLASVFQLLAAKDAELEAEAGLIGAARDYWVANAELERAVGGTVRLSAKD